MFHFPSSDPPIVFEIVSKKKKKEILDWLVKEVSTSIIYKHTILFY